MMRSISISLVAVLYITSAHAQTNCNLSMRWGLESVPNFEEKQQYVDENSAIMSSVNKGKKLRSFRMAKNAQEILFNYFSRHNAALQRFRSEKNIDGEIPRKAFLDWVKENDPFYVAVGRSLAPVIYFDFTGNSGEEYILNEIDIKTYKFDEYSGGGFFDNKSWYDIELTKNVGIRKYNVEKRLRFTGSGRSELRFFSDNYYPSNAMTPQGSYTLSITFIFVRNGKQCSVSTGRFMVDV